MAINLLSSTPFKQIKKYATGIRVYDIPTLLYLSIWIILILIFWSRIPLAFEFLICHFVLLLIILFWIAKPPQLKIVQIARQYYAVAFLFVFFGFLNHLIPAINPRIIDQMLIEWDHWLFGQHPTVWFQSLYNPFLTEILQWSYLGYYFLPLTVPVALHLANKPEKIDGYITIVITAFYLFFFGNLVFPAYGPRFFLAHLHTQPLQGIWLAEAIQQTLNNMEKIQLDAFPSGHASIIFVLMYYTFKHVRKLFWGILPVCVALLISTVYLRLHYVVDVIAGLILAVIVLGAFKMTVEKDRGDPTQPPL